MVSALRGCLTFFLFFFSSVTALGPERGLPTSPVCAPLGAEQGDAQKSLDTGNDDSEACDAGGLLPAPLRVAAIIGMGLMAGGTLAVPHPTSSAVLLSF